MAQGRTGFVLRLPARVALPVLLAGCSPKTSWLAGAGTGALETERMMWIMLSGAVLIWAAVMALAFWAARTNPEDPRKTEALARDLVRWGGLVFPIAVVTTLLIWALFMMRGAADARADMVVAVEGEQWWWRVTYDPGTEAETVTANEIRLPVGQSVRFLLTSDDVIHSFWVPALGGKTDMIPGRETSLLLHPVREGAWTGICAEYCGGAHAQMRLEVIVEPAEDFAAWRAGLAEPVAAADHPGLDLFLTHGCGACHTLRGTPANGQVGPELTHLAARTTLGAGILPMEREVLADWITHTHDLKPGVLMPAYPDLPPQALDTLVDFLMALE